MRLLLDEMISPRIARELREKGFDVQAIKRDRPDLESIPDLELVRRASTERRAVVTNNVADFRPLHDRFLASGEDHYGMIFTGDATMPRSREAIPRWIATLAELLEAFPAAEALRNRVHHLP